MASATASCSPTFANADTYPNCQNWSVQQITGGNVYLGEGIATPTATSNSGILGPTGTASKEASVNSLPLISFNFAVSANNTAFSLSWNYT